MTRIALITAHAARGLDEDMKPLLAALRDAGAQADECDWDDDQIDWSRFDLALLRSAWDYSRRLPEFLDFIKRASEQTCLLNPPEVVRWNTDKHYLGELGSAGVPVVPSTFVEPGEDAAVAIDCFLTEVSPLTPALSTQAGRGDQNRVPASDFEFVIKPCVGAGSRDAQRHHAENRGEAILHLQRLHDSGRSALLQPYLHSVDEHGETALLYFNGTFSHAIRKGPLLKRGEGPVRALFAAEHILPRTPARDEYEVAQSALAAIPFNRPLLYARVDLIRDERDAPRLLELELVEPSVFLAHHDGAAGRFVAAILSRVPT